MGWERVFVWAYEAARTEVDPSVVAEGLLSISRLDRQRVEVARVHMLGLVLDRPDDQVGRHALRCISMALRDGDHSRVWLPPNADVDPWSVAQHRPLSA